MTFVLEIQKVHSDYILQRSLFGPSRFSYYIHPASERFWLTLFFASVKFPTYLCTTFRLFSGYFDAGFASKCWGVVSISTTTDRQYDRGAMIGGRNLYAAYSFSSTRHTPTSSWRRDGRTTWPRLIEVLTQLFLRSQQSYSITTACDAIWNCVWILCIVIFGSDDCVPARRWLVSPLPGLDVVVANPSIDPCSN